VEFKVFKKFKLALTVSLSLKLIFKNFKNKIYLKTFQKIVYFQFTNMLCEKEKKFDFFLCSTSK